jgi:type IV fimbrial biogenesis protein FimT
MGHRSKGFTLVEAIVTMSVASILLAIGVPALVALADRARAMTAMQALRADLALARGAAIMRRQQVVACPSPDGAGCASGSNWSEGWLVFMDADGNRQPDRPGDVLHVRRLPARDRRLLGVTANRAFVRYQVDGRSANSNLTFSICSRGNLAGKVILSNMGRVRTEPAAPGSSCAMP